jgi:hypothetical protein
MVSSIVLQISILFIPGIIWAQIHSIYASRRKPNQFEFIVNSLLFGLVSYTFAALLARVFCIPFALPKVNTGEAQIDLGTSLSQLILPLLSASILSVAWCFWENNAVFAHIINKIGASKSFGNQDVWEFTFNSGDKSAEFVNIRDYQNNLVYAGFVRAWSGSDQTREILLVDVRVHDEDGLELYAMPMMYLSREKETLTIEFPSTQNNGA